MAPRTSTPRVARYRERERAGRALYTIELDTARLEEMLREAGQLTAIEPEHADTEDALRRFIEWTIVAHETGYDP